MTDAAETVATGVKARQVVIRSGRLRAGVSRMRGTRQAARTTRVPNHAPDGTQVDNHDFLTGSDTTGKLYGTNSFGATCNDWVSSVGSDGKPRVGHSWPRQGSGENWMSALDEAGCDYLFNSLKWWDFESPWLLEQYEKFRHIAPSIAFPESA